jgi:ADP-ribose pyrophosphatase
MEPTEAPEITAAREIREEIGMAAQSIHPIGGFFLAPGYSTEFMHLFLATGLGPDPLSHDEGEYILVEKIPLAKVYQMLDEGKFMDGKTVAILGLMRNKL